MGAGVGMTRPQGRKFLGGVSGKRRGWRGERPGSGCHTTSERKSHADNFRLETGLSLKELGTPPMLAFGALRAWLARRAPQTQVPAEPRAPRAASSRPGELGGRGADFPGAVYLEGRGWVTQTPWLTAVSPVVM